MCDWGAELEGCVEGSIGSRKAGVGEVVPGEGRVSLNEPGRGTIY